MSKRAAVFTPKRKQQQDANTRSLLQLGRIIGTPIKTSTDMIRVALEGIEPTVVQALVDECGYSRHEISWIISARALKRRQEKNKRLSIDETDRLLRAARLQALAKEVIGDQDKSLAWLRRARKPFNGCNAMELMQTEIGSQIVEDLLTQLNVGYYA